VPVVIIISASTTIDEDARQAHLCRGPLASSDDASHLRDYASAAGLRRERKCETGRDKRLVFEGQVAEFVGAACADDCNIDRPGWIEEAFLTV